MTRLAALALVALVCPGCLTGLIYSRVTVPLDVNLDETPVQSDYAHESWNTIQYYVQVHWGSDGIGDVAKQYGFTRVYYADLETLRVFGVWTQRTVHVYGERGTP
jgi:hypothetical protein